MAQATQPYRRSLSGSIGAGMKSVFGGGGRTYYMLVHKVSSKYHKAGESQPIIVDQIEIGRDSKCQVRFDESFTTVSRRHAAIVKDGDKWKLVQLSTTNSTYLNGQKVHKEWYLQNGDEIQLSTNGPKLGFVVPEGEKGKVSSIGLTARLNLFRQQALRPYKTALTVMASVLLLVIVGATWGLVNADKRIKADSIQIAQLMKQKETDSIAMDSLGRMLDENIKKLKESALKIDSLGKKLASTQYQLRKMQVNANVSSSMLSQYANSTYYLQFQASFLGNTLGCSGTGFLLEDGRFVTAQHCVNLAMFPQRSQALFALIALAKYQPSLVTYKIIATSPNDQFEMTFTPNDNPFHWGSLDYRCITSIELNGVPYPVYASYQLDYRDYAWLQTNKKGNIPIDAEFSKNMPAGTKLSILGFPQGEGAEKLTNITPLFSESAVAREGLNEKGCIQLSNDETDHGNSGGPVFAVHNGKAVVVGILSGSSALGGDPDAKWKGRVVPISAIGGK